MKIYIDFDGTMFNTHKMYQEFLNICAKYGINEKEIAEISNSKLFSLDSVSNNIYDKYNLGQEFLKQVQLLYDSKYLYKDVIPFLEKSYQKYNLYILSFGEKNYQLNKINCCNIKKYFKDIIISNNKGKETIDYQNSWFIDNNPKDIEILSKVGASKIIRIKRNDDPYSKIPCKVKAKEFFDFNKIDVL